MKKLLFLLVAVVLIFVGCAPKASNGQNNALKGDAIATDGGLNSALKDISPTPDTTTKIQLNIAGGDNNQEKSVLLILNVTKTDFSLNYTGERNLALNGGLTGASIQEQIKNAFSDALTPPQAPGDEDYSAPSVDLEQGLTFLQDIDALFTLNTQTVRGVEIIDGTDNTITYLIDIYESQVKNALPILALEFEKIVDVTGLSLKVVVSGTKTQVFLNVTAIYQGQASPSTIALYIEHTKIVKVID